MKTITFITTNKGKVTSLQRLLPKEYTLIHKEIELPEIQAHSASEVSIWKAKAAYAMLHTPLAVQDSSFHIPVLQGFPGVYIKYALETIGIEGILKLMEGMTDRSYYFEGALTYIESDECIQTFVWHSKPGTIVDKIEDVISGVSWGRLWQIVIPYGKTKTLAALSNEIDVNKEGIDDTSEFMQFVHWLESKRKQ